MRQTGSAPLTRAPDLPSYDPDEIDEAPGDEAEAAEEQILDQATAAADLAELEAEIAILKDLEDQALRLKLSGQDAKWRELESILDDPIMLDPATGPAAQDHHLHRAQGHARIPAAEDRRRASAIPRRSS